MPRKRTRSCGRNGPKRVSKICRISPERGAGGKSRLELLCTTPGLEIDSFLGLNSVVSLRACSGCLQAQYSPAAKPKLWHRFGDKNALCALIKEKSRDKTLTAASAEFLRVTFGLRVRHLWGVAPIILTAACESDDLKLAEWYVSAYGVAGFIGNHIDVGTLVSIASSKMHFNTLEWLFKTFDKAPDEEDLSDMYNLACANEDLTMIKNIRTRCSQDDDDENRWLGLLINAAFQRNSEIADWVMAEFKCDRTSVDKLILELVDCGPTLHPGLSWILQKYGLDGASIEVVDTLMGACVSSRGDDMFKPGFRKIWDTVWSHVRAMNLFAELDEYRAIEIAAGKKLMVAIQEEIDWYHSRLSSAEHDQ